MGFSNEAMVHPPRKPWYRSWSTMWCPLLLLVALAAIVPPLVVYRDRLGGSSEDNRPFWNGTGPNDNPFGTCFTMQATAFQPYWKEQQTTTWCGAQFNKTSPIFALPLLNMSQAVGYNVPVVHDTDRQLWEQMTANWCGAEAKIRGPAGEFDAILGDANAWTTIDLNMNLFETIKGVPIGTYKDPDQARWMNNIRVCFTGNRTTVDTGYPYSYE
ncbi:hypothetical protein BCV70DRAFT_215410 [Testicularia cyperi]|uniref:Uncharacterized protein n=1 Tax=Testicularia cyperi TaxID=1882483 RepID=A0A317XVR0_9BASI|nr:hypothetical protein BCV70DRAFT_215410 [Testicularia cyperi]